MPMKMREKNKGDKMSEKKSVYTYTVIRLKDGKPESSIVVFDKYGSSIFTRYCDDESVWFDEKAGGNLTDFFDALFKCNEARLDFYLDVSKKESSEKTEAELELDEEDGAELERRLREKGVDVTIYINEYFMKDFDGRINDPARNTFEDRLARRIVVSSINRKLGLNEEDNEVNKDENSEK